LRREHDLESRLVERDHLGLAVGGGFAAPRHARPIGSLKD
jgi:hypothetical protein